MRALFVVMATCSVASASPAPALVVEWQAPTSCPDREALLAAIAQRLDAPLDSVELAAQIDVESNAAGFTAHVHASEARELSSANCAELVAAVAVVVAREAKPVQHVAVPKTVAVESDERAVVDVDSLLRPTWNFGARVGGMTGNGDVPNLGVAGEVAAFAAWHSLSIELAASLWKSSSASVGTNASVDVSARAFALRLGWRASETGCVPGKGYDSCPVDRVRAWAVVETGWVKGQGVGLDGDGSARSIAVGAGVGYALPLVAGTTGRRISVVGSGEVLGAIDRVAFALADGETLYATPEVAFRAQLGLEVSWR